MDSLEAAAASGDAINGLGTHFMLDLNTYAYGSTLGFDGVDFYLSGRAGVLGEVPACVVAASLIFFEPGYVADAWARSGDVMPRSQAASEFAGVAHRWADEHLSDDLDTARLAELAGKLGDAASVAGAPLFAGWHALPEPEGDKALAVHRVNGLRELRGAMHGAALLTHGVSPHAAVARRTPYMLPVFGWQEPHPDIDDVREPWAEAQAATDLALAPIYEALTADERTEFVTLVDAVQTSVTSA